MRRHDVDAGKQFVKVRLDDVLQKHVGPASAGNCARGNSMNRDNVYGFDAGKPDAMPVTHHHGKVATAVRNERKRMARIECERRQHRAQHRVEIPFQEHVDVGAVVFPLEHAHRGQPAADAAPPSTRRNRAEHAADRAARPVDTFVDISPSGEIVSTPARHCRRSPARPTIWNSSRLLAAIARNLTRSNGGCELSRAWASTRSLKASQLRSRLRKRAGSSVPVIQKIGLTLYPRIGFILLLRGHRCESERRRNRRASTCRPCATTNGEACCPARRDGRPGTASSPMTRCGSCASSSAPRISASRSTRSKNCCGFATTSAAIASSPHRCRKTVKAQKTAGKKGSAPLLRGRLDTRVPHHRGARRRRRSGAMTHVDPVCGMTIEEADAVGTHQHDGVTYYFCNPSCLERFKATRNSSSSPPAPLRLRHRRERRSSVRWTPKSIRRSQGRARNAAWRSNRTCRIRPR